MGRLEKKGVLGKPTAIFESGERPSPHEANVLQTSGTDDHCRIVYIGRQHGRSPCKPLTISRLRHPSE